MRNTILAALLTIAFASQAALAQQKDDEHAAHHPDAQAQGTAPSGKPDDKMRQLSDRMKKIQELMAQIHATSDPAARDDLMKQHLNAMRKQIGAMLAMSPGKMGMMGGGKEMMGEGDSDKGMPDGRKEGMAEGDSAMDVPDAKKEGKGGMMEKGMMMMKMHKQMEGRVRMLEMLLQQMLEREAVEAGVDQDH